MIIGLPAQVRYIMDSLASGGHEAYVVGGCVRDSLLGGEPKDWDVCTSALPEQTKQCFEGCHIIDTGLKHGTVTLMLRHKPFEITTYRADGKYTDNRRPDGVRFVNVLKRDLARRDFTINAMAYNPDAGLVDYYGGLQDLTERKIKCVGNPNKRFNEDALRIMRAMRFASEFGFTVESRTARAMADNRMLLANIAPQRISSELSLLILGDGVKAAILEHIEVIAEIIPELKATIGFEQNNPCHCYDVLNHTLHSVQNAPKDIEIRMAMLLHDIGKVHSYAESEDGVGHFYGHAAPSSDMARGIMKRLKYAQATVKAVTQLISFHDCDIGGIRQIKRLLNEIGEERLRQLIEVKRADAMAQAEGFREEKLAALDRAASLADEIIGQRQCFSLKDLAVNGRDLMDIGITQGAGIGKILSKLLSMVIDEDVANDKETLLRKAGELHMGISENPE